MFSDSQRGKVHDLRHAGLLHRLDLFCSGIPQHAGQVYGGCADFCHSGLQLWPVDLHLPAQVLHPPDQTWTQQGGHDEAPHQTTWRNLHCNLSLIGHSCYRGWNGCRVQCHWWLEQQDEEPNTGHPQYVNMLLLIYNHHVSVGWYLKGSSSAMINLNQM